MSDPLDAAIANETQRQNTQAASNKLLGVQGIPPQAGAAALAAGPSVGVPPDSAVYNPGPVTDAAKQQENTQAVSGSPPLASYMAARGPAVAATVQRDMPGLADIGNMTKAVSDNLMGMAEEFNPSRFYKSMNDYINLPFSQALTAWKQAQIDSVRQYKAEQAGDILGTIAAGGSQLKDAADILTSPFAPIGRFVGDTFVTPVAKALAYIPGIDNPTYEQRVVSWESIIGNSLQGLGSEGGMLKGVPRPPRPPIDVAFRDVTQPKVPYNTPPALTDTRPFEGSPQFQANAWKTTDEDVVADANGNPVSFTNPDVAQSWIDNLGHSWGTHGQLFEVAPADDGTASVVQTGRIPPPADDVTPVGASMGVDAIRAQKAESDTNAISQLQEKIAKSPLATESPELMADYLNHIAPDKMVEFDPVKAFEDHNLSDAEFSQLPAQVRIDTGKALMDGSTVQMPLGQYLAITAGKPWAQAWNENTTFSEDGLSLAHADAVMAKHGADNGMGTSPKQGAISSSAPIVGPEPQPVTAPEDFSSDAKALYEHLVPEVAKQTKIAADSSYLSTVFKDAKALGMTKSQFDAYGAKIEAAQKAAYEKALAKVAAEIKKYRTVEFKKAYEAAHQEIFQNLMADPGMAAYNTLKYSKDETIGGSGEVYFKGPDGKPQEFYHGTNHVDIEKWEIPTWSGRQGVSLTDSKEFVNRWINHNYGAIPSEGESKVTETGQYISGKYPVTYIVHVAIPNEKVGDYKNPKDVDKAERWYADVQHKSDVRYDLERGSWSEWERKALADAMGWQAVRMYESPSYGEHHNIFVFDPDKIHFKFQLNGKDIPAVKLDPAIKDAYPNVTFPKGIFRKDGLGLEEAAAHFGFDSPEELITSLEQIEKARSGKSFKKWMMDEVKAAAQAQAEQDTGIDLSPEAIRKAAEESFAAPTAVDILIDELHGFYQMAGRQPLSRAAIKAQAEASFEDMPFVQATNIKKFQKNVKMHGDYAERFVIKGKFDFAVAAKQRQILQTFQLDMAWKLSREADVMAGKIKTWAGSGAIESYDQTWLNYIHEQLIQNGHNVNRDPQELMANIQARSAGMSTEAFGAFVNEASLTGDLVDMDALQSRRVDAEQDSWPVWQWRATMKFLDNFAAQARAAQDVTVAGERMELAHIGLVAERNAGQAGRRFPNEANKNYLSESGSDLQKTGISIAQFIRQMDAYQLTVETAMDWADGSSYGVLNKTVVAPRAAADAKYKELQDMVAEHLIDLMRSLPGHNQGGFQKTGRMPLLNVPNELRFNTGDSRHVLTLRGNLWRVMQNMGTASNLDKLCKGMGWDPEVLVPWVMKEATDADWKYVQGFWDIHEKLWPKIEELWRNVRGVAPVKEEPIGSEFFQGKASGGYANLVYDQDLIDFVKGKNDPLYQELFNDRRFTSAPTSGYFNKRTNYSAPIDLDPSLMAGNLSQVLFDLAYREPLEQIWKVINQPKVSIALKQTLGPEIAKTVEDSFKQLVAGNNVPEGITNKIVSAIESIRKTQVFEGVAFRVSTLILHPATAAMHGMGEAGPVSWALATRDYHFNKDIQAFVNANSKEIGLSNGLLDKDFSDAYDSILKEPSYLQGYEKLGFAGIQHFSKASSYGLWLAVYRRELALVPDEDRAKFLAEKAVRQTHGSSITSDIPTYLRGGGVFGIELGRLMFSFMRFLSTFRQRDWTASQRFGRLARGGFSDTYNGMPQAGGGGGGFLGGPPGPGGTALPPPELPPGSENLGDAPKVSRKEDFRTLMNYLTYFILGSAAISTVVNYGKNPGKGWLNAAEMAFADRLIAPFPGGRDLLWAIESFKDPSGFSMSSALSEIAKDFVHVGSAAYTAGDNLLEHKQKQLDPHWAESLVNLLGYNRLGPFGRIPIVPGQVTHGAQFLLNQNRQPAGLRPNKYKANTPGELVHGMITGNTGRKEP